MPGSRPLISMLLAICLGPLTVLAADLETELAECTTTLPPGDPVAWTDADLTWLDDTADAPLLAFGEASHGGREFVTVRRRLLRYLAENHGFRVLALEAHVTECVLLEQCLDDPDCDLAGAMADHMLIWTSRTTQMLDVLTWLREHNAGRPASERVRLVGIDAQVQDQVRPVLRALAGTSAAELAAGVDSLLIPLADLGREDYAGMEDDAYAAWRDGLDSLAQGYADAAMNGLVGDAAAREAARVITAAGQSLEFLRSWFRDGRNVRDRHLAENVAGILADAEAAGAGVVLWAHNAHVAVHRDYAEEAGGNLGWHLRERLGARYRPVALTFNRGEIRAKVLDGDGRATAQPRHVVLAVTPPDSSLNAMLEQAGPPPLLIDLRQVDRGSGLGLRLARPQALLGVGDLFLGWENLGKYHYGGDRVLRPLEAFDLILHLGSVGPTDPLPEVPHDSRE